jgi:bacteriorhodopsin
LREQRCQQWHAVGTQLFGARLFFQHHRRERDVQQRFEFAKISSIAFMALLMYSGEYSA